MFSEEVEKVPLRHQRNVFAVRRQMRQVDNGQVFVAKLHAETLDFLMRQLEKLIEQTKLVH